MMHVSAPKKSVFLCTCFFVLANIQPAKASPLLGSLVCNGIGLTCSYFGFGQLRRSLIWFWTSSEIRKSGSLGDFVDAKKMEKKAIGHAMFGIFLSGFSFGFHALGFLLMWEKIEKNSQAKKLNDEHVCCENHQGNAEVTLGSLLKKDQK